MEDEQKEESKSENNYVYINFHYKTTGEFEYTHDELLYNLFCCIICVSVVFSFS